MAEDKHTAMEEMYGKTFRNVKEGDFYF